MSYHQDVDLAGFGRGWRPFWGGVVGGPGRPWGRNCFRFASPPRPLEGLRPRGYDEVVGKASEKAKRGMILGLSSFFLALLTLIRINDLA